MPWIQPFQRKPSSVRKKQNFEKDRPSRNLTRGRLKGVSPKFSKRVWKATRNKLNSRKTFWPSIWRAQWFQVSIFLRNWLFLLRISLKTPIYWTQPSPLRLSSSELSLTPSAPDTRGQYPKEPTQPSKAPSEKFKPVDLSIFIITKTRTAKLDSGQP